MRLFATTKRRGLTLIEIVVVLAVIGILTSLSLVALSRAREAQRKLTCQTRLKQLALATHNFVSAQGHLPEGSVQVVGGRAGHLSVLARILPYIEQRELAARASQRQYVRFSPDPPAYGPATEYVELYNCPSDPITGGNSFRACTGSTHLFSDAPWYGLEKPAGNGAFPGSRRIRLAEITDGLANTVAFSEKRKSDTLSLQFNPSTDVWLSGIVHVVNPHEASTDEIIRLCSLVPNRPTTFYGNAGYTWLYAGYFCTQHNHAIGPNPAMSDCDCHSSSSIYGILGIYPATSYHSGGVNVAMLDGSTHFISDSVDLSVWRAIGTRNGGEVPNF